MLATVTLPANRTYAHRHATLVRVSKDDQPVLGVLEIRESRTEDGKPKCSRYAIRQDSWPGRGDGVYLLTKPECAAMYSACLPADRAEYPVCTCTGYEAKGYCKHLCALEALCRDGQIDPK